MERQKVDPKRVLARRLAKELSPKDLAAIGGQGTSYSGTIRCIDGRGADTQAVDCCDGPDRFEC